jgi:CheY-like chemotaxis protein
VGKQAFLVDDSRSARIVLSRLLKKNGFDEVEMAESGEQALEQLQNLQPDAIFVDFLMDGMDGLETISALKKDTRFANTPVVMCTANEGDRYLQAAIEHGALGILAKPPTDESLKAIIDLIETQELELQTIAAANDESTPVSGGGVSEQAIRDLAIQAARTAAKSTATGIAQDQAEAIAKQVASDTVTELLEAQVSELVDRRLALFEPPKVDVAALQETVVTQVNRDLEEYVRQINQRTVESLIEARVYEVVKKLAHDFHQRLQDVKQEIMSQVPEKNEMIEHIRVVTEGTLEAHVREVATQVSQEMANSVATETVEHLLDEHLAAQARSTPVPQGTGRGRQLLWLGLMLLGAGLLGYALYSLPSLL